MSRRQQMLVPNFRLRFGSAALPEIFDLLYKVGGSAATAVFGRHTLTYNGNTTGNFVDYLSAAAVKALLEAGVYGSVSVSLVSKGYRVTVASPTGNLANPTLTPSTTYTLNDGAGTAPNKTSQRNYTAGSSGVSEVVSFAYTLDPPGGSPADASDTNGNAISYNGIGWNPASNAPFWSLNVDGADGTATFTDQGQGPKNSAQASATGMTGSVTVVTPGVASVAEILGQCVIGFTGAAGYFTFADGFTALAIPITSTGAAIKALLNGATGYNAAKVETVTVGATSITIDYATSQQPTGTITIGGRTGAAVVASIAGVQDGS